MYKYNCNPCEFSTDIKNDYTRHMNTNKHIQNVADLIVQQETFECPHCGNTYASQSSRSKHMNKCAKANIDNIVKQKDAEIKEVKTTAELSSMKEKIVLYEKALTDKDKQLTTYERMLMSLATPQSINYFTYISTNYPNTKALRGQNSYVSMLEAKTMTLIEVITMYYENKTFINFIGDYIVKLYKKEEPKDQSVWSTDISRLTYIISESCKKGENVWTYDKKGVKLRSLIIDPALQYIKTELHKFCQENGHVTSDPEFSQLKAALEILPLINNGTLSVDISRYIAPQFQIQIKDNFDPLNGSPDMEKIKELIKEKSKEKNLKNNSKKIKVKLIEN